MYYFKLGVTGAAISTVVSQYVLYAFIPSLGILFYLFFTSHHAKIFSCRYIVAFLMIWNLNKRVVLLPPKMGSLQFGVYLKSGNFFTSSKKETETK